jgi:hypothetical protein
LPDAERPRVVAGGQAVIAHQDEVRARGAEPEGRLGQKSLRPRAKESTEAAP